MQTVHTYHASVHQAAKLVAALSRVARVTAGLAESNCSLQPGLWLTPPAGWLPRTEPYARQSSMGYLFLPVSHYLDEAEERLQFAVRASVRPLTAECVAGGASAGQSAARAHVAGRGWRPAACRPGRRRSDGVVDRQRAPPMPRPALQHHPSRPPPDQSPPAIQWVLQSVHFGSISCRRSCCYRFYQTNPLLSSTVMFVV